MSKALTYRGKVLNRSSVSGLHSNDPEYVSIHFPSIQKKKLNRH